MKRKGQDPKAGEGIGGEQDWGLAQKKTIM